MRSWFQRSLLPIPMLAVLLGCGPTDLDPDEEEAASAELGIQSVSVEVAGYPVWAHFTDPPKHSGVDETIIDEVKRLIATTEKGGQIQMAIHSLSLPGVVDGLLARADEVQIQIAQDGKNDFTDADSAAHELANDPRIENVFCGDGTKDGNLGCITSHESGIMHTKLALFSAAEDPDGKLHPQVSWFGSANLTEPTGKKSFNNTITVYGDGELYAGLRAYFNQLLHEDHFSGNDYLDSQAGHGLIDTDTSRVSLSPEADGDIVERALDSIHAAPGCRIRVSQAMIFKSRLNLVQLLVDKKEKGCQVWVVTNEIAPEAVQMLKSAKIPAHKRRVHDKFVIVRARFGDDTARRDVVFTGSHNWTTSANSINDELFVRIDSTDLYNAYYHHFRDAYAQGKPLWK